MVRLKEIYGRETIPLMMKKFSLDNPMKVPKIEKVCVNVGVGAAKTDPKLLETARKVIALITGQQTIVTKAKKSIAGFNLREGMVIGCATTLRGDMMYEFLDRLFNLTMPRIRDFQGVSPDGFDGRGNFTLGLRDQLVFPEVEYDEAMKGQGLSITIVTTASNDTEAKELLLSLGMPFKQ